MTQSHIEFLKSLIQTDTTNPPGNEDAVVDLFKQRCVQENMPYKITEIENNRSNFSVLLKGSGDHKDKLLLSGHTDTVKIGSQKWKYAPFDATIKDGKMYGRGTTDMKSGLAALYLALESLNKDGITLKKDVEFLATAGEEVDSIGAHHYVNNEDMEHISAIIIAEPTQEKVVVGHKGALWIEVKLSGKTAHGAMPEYGVNAVEAMNKVLNLVNQLKEEWHEEKEPLGSSSISANMINGGIQTNVIPDHCILNVDIRTVTPNIHDQLYDAFTRRIKALFSDQDYPHVETKILLNRAAILTDEQQTIIQNAQSLASSNNVSGVAYYTDGSVFNPDSQIPTLIYGPGIETLAHQPDEYVEIDAFERSIEYFKNLIKHYAS